MIPQISTILLLFISWQNEPGKTNSLTWPK